MNENAWTFICWSCGAAIPGWWKAAHAQRPLYDVAADDAAYEKWRNTPCPKCGKTPAEGESKARE